MAPLLLLLAACSSTPAGSGSPTTQADGMTIAGLEEDLQHVLDQSDLPSAAVVLDAKTGEVIAQAEQPAGTSRHPLQDGRHPGSSMKPLLYAFALEQGVITTDHHLTCDGSFEAGGETLTCFTEHGELDLKRALATSCNEYAYDVATRVGVEKVAARYRGLSLCDRDAKADLALAIGHGDLRVTPSQVAHAYRQALVAGDSSHRSAIIEGMIAAVESEEGTARAARVDGLRVAGKTGTSEADAGGYDGTFVALAPADDPEIVLVVYATGEGTAPETAVPIAGEILRRWQARRSAG